MLFALSERLLNRFIAESTAAEKMSHELGGTSMAIEVSGLPLSIVLEAGDDGISVRRGPAADASVSISASLPDLLRLTGPDPLTRIRRSGVEISGDPQVAEAYGRLLEMAAPDVEEELARWVGDIAAHRVCELVRAAARTAATTGRALEANTAEFLQHESAMLPSAPELDAFLEDVDELREHVDRSAARFERLLEQRAR